MESINNSSSAVLVAPKKIYRWYLILSIIYSSISILTGIVFFVPESLFLVSLIWGPVILVWFLLSIVMFILIFTKKIEKIALLLPGLYIFDQIFSVIVGFVAGAVIGEAAYSSLIVLGLGLLFPVIILGISIHLVLRK